MRKPTAISLLVIVMLSALFAGDLTVTQRLKKAAKQIKSKYPNITQESIESQVMNPNQRSNRDMSDIVGEWLVEDESQDMYITVATDQSHPNVSQMMALEEGEGSIHVSTEFFEADLTYFLDGYIFEDEAARNNRNVYALEYAQNYVNDNAENQGQSIFDLTGEFNLTVDGENVSGGLGGNNPDNCEINWPTDPYKAAVYSFVSEYVIYEGGSVGCFFDYYSDQTYGFVAEELEGDWAGGGNDDDICFYLEMFDSECDGWGDAYWTVVDGSGDIVENGSLWDDACFGDVDICLEPGYYTFNCIGTGTDTDDEISWTLYDSNYETIADGGANDGISFELEDTGEEEGAPYGFIMNMNFMEFFMFLFGEETLVENPTIIAFGSSTDNEQIDMVEGITLIDNEMIEFSADTETALSLTSIDTTNHTITFSDLVLVDETDELSMALSGTFGPEMVEYLAGVETLIEFPDELFDEGTDDDNTDIYTYFYSDSTGMELYVEFDEESHETWSDTSYFEWSATPDTLYLMYEDEEEIELEYAIINDTLFAGGYFYPCEEDYNSYEECFYDADFMFLDNFTDVEGFRVYSERSASWVGTASNNDNVNIIINDYRLYPVYPNPFNPTATVRFNIPTGKSNQNTSLQVFDLSGRMVESILNKKLEPGQHIIKWNGKHQPSGVYILRIESGSFSQTQKMILLK
ncbi:MAG: T9SS type A sorting domain-containing protein [Candidatus Marinimicrobia bacterium]|jgi:hypothetical protein|nr:T9SS type A sorting domain-containing protein [Candidatus Neomarinimicrobiota bacterium]MBT4636336.1 T9SS type A sorting domain-containing protein [Candidatus Neomarinimicrobiota bacterium]MBT4684795.1 T9SS type A sorting domain-containing protein [Candidatus Neomarinimicrobiota bacterium]MBT4736402.1 T9SS type A sorting domain-containing protein [Candidatus Neomarinimicrobiota bacterium]MBT5069654.1 T9SS type A sorting domain-containing protein [Candidatus Neomarinimicrobiota bacterium]